MRGGIMIRPKKGPLPKFISYMNETKTKTQTKTKTDTDNEIETEIKTRLM